MEVQILISLHALALLVGSRKDVQHATNCSRNPKGSWPNRD